MPLVTESESDCRRGPATRKVVKRLSVYRRLLDRLGQEGTKNVFSHDLASRAGVTAAQVRRDLMTIGFSGSPSRGYDVARMVEKIGEYLDAPQWQSVVLVGVGHVGQALLAYFSGRGPHLAINGAFDADPAKANRVIQGCRCYPVDEMEDRVRQLGAEVGIIAVPGDAAQQTALQLVRGGVRGILNFAPTHLRLPEYVYVENVDITVLLERVAFFARQGSLDKEAVR